MADFSKNQKEFDCTGILHYSSKGLVLSSNNLSMRKIISQNSVIYGYGTLNGTTEQGKKMTFGVMLTLNGFAVLESKDNGSFVGAVNYSKWRILSAFIGDYFVTSETNFEKVNIYPTNFANWLEGDANNPLYVLPDDYTGVATIKSQNIYTLATEKNDDFQLKLRREESSVNANNSVSTITSKIVVSNSVQLLTSGSSIQQLILRKSQVNSWYNLCTNNAEKLYKVEGEKKQIEGKPIETVQLFENNYPETSLNDYAHISTFLRRDAAWYKNILASLSRWIDKYDFFVPIFNSIRPDLIGDTDQRLQNECVALELIFDHFYTEEYVKSHPEDDKASDHGHDKNNKSVETKRITYYNKVKYILDGKFDSELLHQSISKLSGTRTQDSFEKGIKDLRNVLSHSATSLEGIPFSKRVNFEVLLRILIRNWLLSQIGIDSKYRDIEYKVNKPFNYTITQLWKGLQ